MNSKSNELRMFILKFQLIYKRVKSLRKAVKLLPLGRRYTDFIQ
jgi:hypothetical protein